MISISSRDLFFSVILHGALILMVTVLNPFVVRSSHDLESIGVNIISMPPLGIPDLIQGGKMPEIAIPQALVQDEVAIPIAAPESKRELKKIEKKSKPKETEHKPKPEKDLGYQALAQKGDKTQKGGADINDKVGPGSKFGSVVIDNVNFNYPYYFTQTYEKIGQNWSNPVAANQPLSCVIYFKIIRSGTIMDPVVEKSSGIEAYDRACLRAVVAASPLPLLPTDFHDDIIGIHLEFPWKP